MSRRVREARHEQVSAPSVEESCRSTVHQAAEVNRGRAVAALGPLASLFCRQLRTAAVVKKSNWLERLCIDEDEPAFRAVEDPVEPKSAIFNFLGSSRER